MDMDMDIDIDMYHHRTGNTGRVPVSQRTGELREVTDILQIVSKGKLQRV